MYILEDVISAKYITVKCFKIVYILLQISVNGGNAVGGIQTYKSYRRSNLQNQTMLTRSLWNQGGVRNAPRCSQMCNNDENCISFFYNNQQKFCQGHSITLGNEDNSTTEQTGNSYYILEKGDGYIGDACQNSSTCKVENSECRANACWCSPGYSFWPRNQSCVHNCTEYGSEFTEVFGYFLSGNNEEDYLSIPFENCVRLCTQASTYVCRTFEYGWKTNNCYLQSVTKHDVPGAWFADTTTGLYAHYQRDCL